MAAAAKSVLKTASSIRIAEDDFLVCIAGIIQPCKTGTIKIIVCDSFSLGYVKGGVDFSQGDEEVELIVANFLHNEKRNKTS
ncbi:hypothetical protein AMAG_20121 [Allomyces macrogynus ATCC 38327]|uniref:Uncharacterized protein n=1 Tax=Allomyces macrogynus (strain ATCC 38327) TaxID=578462 RepID=A0A0L0T7G0_ALLM3|nr:hypothetical protein AMAG_20121 [Allomyces macrogynus ATCC 38327]|eukprot:KNE70474.1 hypothetical protein AMAG_20121 [Allomyces macrogynus ATCC 38327]